MGFQIIELVELERQTQGVYQRIISTLASALQSTSIERTSSSSSINSTQSHVVLGPLQSYAIKCSLSRENFSQYLSETALTRLERLLNEELKERGKMIRNILAEAQGKLGKCHEVLLDAINSHEKGLEIRIRLEKEDMTEGMHALSDALSRTDIFITEQRLKHLILVFLKEKESFCDILMEQFGLAQTLEGDLATALRSILIEAMKFKEQQLATTIELMDDCCDNMRAEPLWGWKQAMKRYRLDWDWQVVTPPLDGFTASVLTQIGFSLSNGTELPMVKLTRIVKSGYLMRAGTFGRSWLILFCLLVDSNFLHCYTPEDLIKSLKRTNSVDEASHKILRIPSPSMNLHRQGLIELNSLAARMWLTKSSKFGVDHSDSNEKSADPFLLCSPTLSIPLLHPSTTVTPDANNADKYMFSIMIPGGNSFFGRGERRHTLRSFMEEDMVDWCIAIKEVIASNKEHTSNSNIYNKSPIVTRSPAHQLADNQPQMERESVESQQDKKWYDSDAEPRSTPTTPIGEIDNPWE